MTWHRWWIALACAGCGVTPEPYEVLAAANLAPGTLDIAGPLQILGRGQASGFVLYYAIAAYHVRLPDDTPRRIRLLSPAACDAPPEQTALIWELGEIRRVGDETHFFARGIPDGHRPVAVDIETTAAYVDLSSQGTFGASSLMAVVQDLPPDGEPWQEGPVAGPPGSATGDRLACGLFTVPP